MLLEQEPQIKLQILNKESECGYIHLHRFYNVHNSFTYIIALDPLTQYFSKVSRPDNSSILQRKTLTFRKVK